MRNSAIFAPFYTAANTLIKLRKRFTLHYFTQSPEHTAFRELFNSQGFRELVTYYHGVTPESLLTLVPKILEDWSPGTCLYLCGPRPFMDLVKRCAQAWPSECVRYEYFSASPTENQEPKTEFEIELAHIGGTYAVLPSQTITQVLQDNGIYIETSCEEGLCGTCLTGVLGGVPDHRDSFLTDKEKASGNKIMPCVSRSKTPRLILDL